MSEAFKIVKEILAPPNNGQIYIIPPYQRAYSWGKDECLKLVDDILDNPSEYYIGSVIYVNSKPNEDGTIKCALIDGQQRMTTISLLLLAIYKVLNVNYKEKLDKIDPFSTRHDMLNAIYKELLYRDSSDDHPISNRLVLQHISSNNNDYDYLINKELLNKNPKQPAYFSSRKISLNFNHIYKKIENFSYEEIFKLLEYTQNLKIVVLPVDDEQHALIMFEALNNRGLPLSPVDLIKNKLFIKLIDKNPSLKADDLNDEWSQITDSLSDDSVLLERFFRHYYNAFISSSNSQRTTRTKMVSMYESALDNNPMSIFKDLIDKASIYSELTNNIQEDKSYSSALNDVSHIKAAPAYVLLLYIFSNKDTLNLNDDDLKEIANSITIFFLRRHITDKPATRELDTIFINIIKLINKKQSKEVVKLIKKELYSKIVEDTDFKNALSGDIYLDNADVTRFILCYLCNNFGNESNDYWARKKNTYIWTIEHILPKSKNSLSETWKKMISPDDLNKALDVRAEYVHKLGNLTLSGYNGELGDGDFIEKQNRKDKKTGKMIGYKNMIKLNIMEDPDNLEDINLSRTTKWTPKQIKKRTQVMIEQIVNHFPKK